jgi:hypothetical protein
MIRSNSAPIGLSIIVPCYNEQDVLPEIARQLLSKDNKKYNSKRDIQESSRSEGKVMRRGILK